MMYKIIKNQTDVRLDVFLEGKLSHSRSKVQKLIKTGDILVNGSLVKPSYQLCETDQVYVNIDDHEPKQNMIDESFKIDYLYEDADILVLNKPSGMIVEGFQQSVLTDYIERDNIQLNVDLTRKGVVHRLDKHTEGVMVLAKSQQAHDALKQQFKNRLVVKKYYAVVSGNFMHDSYTVEKPIGRHPKKRQLFRVDLAGKHAVTHIQVVKRYNTKTLCSVEIETGRTHQIRVHLSYLGFPILKDPDYGKLKHAAGQLLQSYFLSFLHPCNQNLFSFELPLSSRLIN